MMPTVSQLSKQSTEEEQESEIVLCYDSIAISILLAQLHARAQQDGVLSLFDQSDQNSLISLIVADALANQKQNIFKQRIENSLTYMSYKNFATLILNEVTWKQVFY